MRPSGKGGEGREERSSADRRDPLVLEVSGHGDTRAAGHGRASGSGSAPPDRLARCSGSRSDRGRRVAGGSM
jgi:hypothetical protein